MQGGKKEDKEGEEVKKEGQKKEEEVKKEEGQKEGRRRIRSMRWKR